jgi:hypothetical protein
MGIDIVCIIDLGKCVYYVDLYSLKKSSATGAITNWVFPAKMVPERPKENAGYFIQAGSWATNKSES